MQLWSRSSVARHVLLVTCVIICLHAPSEAKKIQRRIFNTQRRQNRELLQCGAPPQNVPDPSPEENECISQTDNCDDDNAVCQDTADSFTCTCNAGWTSSNEGVTCQTNVNECTSGGNSCHSQAACSDTPGSFTCACNAGYDGDGVSACDNVDECSSNPCHSEASCVDSPGSYTCTCNTGYSGNGVTCANINECSADSDTCHSMATCTDSSGSFTCACTSGYTGDGVTCSDVDECNDSPCHAEAQCMNAQGSFTCACNSGFVGDGTSSCEIPPADAVDECATGAHNCDANADCTDLAFGFSCQCKSGFSGNGEQCSPDAVDECTTGAHNCDANADCTDLANGFSCQCRSGFSGNGEQCAADEQSNEEGEQGEQGQPAEEEEEEQEGESFQVSGSAELEGLTVGEVDANPGAVAAAIAETQEGVAAGDVEITRVEALPGTGARRLLAEGVRVDFVVTGFETESAAAQVATTLAAAGEELVAELREQGLTAVTAAAMSDVAAEKIALVPEPGATPEDSQPNAAARTAGSICTLALSLCAVPVLAAAVHASAQ